MKKRSKRAMSLLLAAGMTLGLTACGGNTGNSAEKNAEAKNYVYRMEDIETDAIDANSNIAGVTCAGDRIYMLETQRRWDELTGTVVNLISVKLDGSDEQVIEIMSNLRENPDYVPEGMTGEDGGAGDAEVMPMPRTEEATEDTTTDTTTDAATTEETTTTDTDAKVYQDFWINSNAIGEAGIFFLAESNSYSIDADGNQTDLGTELKLYAYDLEGKERYQITLNENQSTEYVYYNYVLPDKDGNLVLISDSKILTIDAQGNPVSENDLQSSEGWMQSAFMGKDGKVNMIWVNNDYTKLILRAYNLQTKAFDADVELPGNLNNYSMSAGTTYDVNLTNSQGLYGYNFGDTDVTPIFSYINSDIDSSNMGGITEIGDGKLFATYLDEETWTTHLAILTHVDPSEIPDKEVLTLACFYLDYNMRKRVVDFNKENQNYRITIKDYSTYSTMDDYKAGVTQLNNDILAGQVPDILILDGYNMSVESYISKGILADIGKMIEEDEELNMDDYMSNVFDAYKVDGKLYSVIPNFSISTVLGKTSQVGDTPGWTMEDLQALMAKYPDASAFGESMTRESMLWNVMMYSGATYVDRSTGECHFDSDEFIATLEFLAQFPEEFTNNDDSYWMTYESQWRDGRTLLMATSYSDIRSFARNEQGYFGEDVTLIGFPSKEGIGAVVQATNQYAISAKSNNKEGAWEFLRYYLTEEYQTSDDMSWSLPVLKSALLSMIEEAKEQPYWEDENGNKEYYTDTFYIADQEITLQPLTDEEATEVYDYISSVNMAYYFDESLSNIIKEEAAPFFAGQKTAAEAAKIIQSRAQLYINESR